MKQRKKSSIRFKSDIVLPVNKSKLLNVIDKLNQSRPILKDRYAKVYNKNCFQEHNHFRWESPLLLVHYVRKCIITHNWDSLSSLILHLIGKKINIYSSYVREMAFLAMIMNNRRGSDDLLEDFKRLCFVRVPNNVNLSKYDVWYQEEMIKSE